MLSSELERLCSSPIFAMAHKDACRHRFCLCFHVRKPETTASIAFVLKRYHSLLLLISLPSFLNSNPAIGLRFGSTEPFCLELLSQHTPVQAAQLLKALVFLQHRR